MMLLSCQFANCFFQVPPMEEAAPAVPIDRDVYWDPCESDAQCRAGGVGGPIDEVPVRVRLAA